MLYPLHDTIDTPPVKLSAKINVRQGGAQLFNELYRKTSLCFEVDNVTLGCSAIRSTRSEIKIQQLGRFSVRAFLSDVNGDEEPIGERYWLSPTVIFSLVRDSEFTSHLDMHAEARRNQLREDYDLSLVEWARQQQSQRDRRLLESLEEDEVGLHLSQARGGSQREDELVLLIGVKTAVATNFALRQAIRETWASKDALPDGVKVVFLGCRPIARVDEDVADENDWERRRLRDAIMLEKMVNGDLLTDELDCDDTYLDLANKVKEFFHLAAMRFGHAQYVMIADDDVYVRTDMLVSHFKRLGPQTRYYSGQMLSVQHARKEAPTRDTSSRYVLSETQYPLSELPPFAIGAYFFLSMDCVNFISRNRRRLRDLGGMDDITVALWMLTIQVHAQHFPQLRFLRSEPCAENLLAFGDLSSLAIREVDMNILDTRDFCHGFERKLWLKSSRHIPEGGLYRVLPLFTESLEFGFSIGIVNTSTLQITTTVSTPAHAGIKVPYFPLLENFAAYARRVCAEARLSFPVAVGNASCYEIASQLGVGLHKFYQRIQVDRKIEL
ncbi:hypothetical protein PF002_g4409 [Phytophthora fragariae]|uniref:Hexosyltransferase n=2 Tax=Phytophthora fragariae TaxID=53985 RepID=A0A6A4A9S8_9STRA|nr:hypothetical protein PF002_g4409 [Phytophthora fragariae]